WPLGCSRCPDTTLFRSSLDGTAGAEEWRPMLEAGAALGATTLTLAGQDPDLARLGDTLAALAAEAADYGITPALEPISYNTVSKIGRAPSELQSRFDLV